MLLIMIPEQNCLCISHPLHSCHKFCPFHPLLRHQYYLFYKALQFSRPIHNADMAQNSIWKIPQRKYVLTQKKIF